jgi:hypothetical protein
VAVRFPAFILVVLFFASGCAHPKGAQQKPLRVSLEVYAMDGDGHTFTANSTLHAPLNIFLAASVKTAITMHAGDIVFIDFFANTKKLGSRVSIWNDAMEPDPLHNDRPTVLGFNSWGFLWTNVPAGSYVFTVRAHGCRGLSAVSPPVNKTILP